MQVAFKIGNRQVLERKKVYKQKNKNKNVTNFIKIVNKLIMS